MLEGRFEKVPWEEANTYEHNRPYFPCWRERKRLNTGEVEDKQSRPQEDQVEEANQSEEERHVDAVLIANPFLHYDNVYAINDSTSERHCATKSPLLANCAKAYH